MEDDLQGAIVSAFIVISLISFGYVRGYKKALAKGKKDERFSTNG